MFFHYAVVLRNLIFAEVKFTGNLMRIQNVYLKN